MFEHLGWLFSWIIENAMTAIQNSHMLFWNGNECFFVIYVASLTILIDSKGEKTKANRLFVAFSLIAMLSICYNPFIYELFMRLSQSDEAVFSRIWIILPVWMIISFAITELTNRFKSVLVRYELNICIAVGIVIAGLSPITLGYYTDSFSAYKVNTEGSEISDEILSLSGTEPVGILLVSNEQDISNRFVAGGTSYYAIEQYTGMINAEPVYISEQTWNDCYTSELLLDGEAAAIDYINDFFIMCRRAFDYSYVVTPQEESLRDIMMFSGYQYLETICGNDIYVAIPIWRVESFSGLLESNKKVYVISDNMGHFIVVGGGSKSDRRQLQIIMEYCGNHVDAWILTTPSAESVEGLNCIVTTEGYVVDRVYMPAIDYDNLPEGFMDEADWTTYEDFLDLAGEGLFELTCVAEGDEFVLYGMSFQILSDMLDVQEGDVVDNSMLFRMRTGNQSFLFCSCIGYEQGQLALEKYGEGLNSDYVQIASGSGDGLGLDFYDAVSPDIAFCDSLKDDAGRKTYDLLVSAGVSCYCLENGDPSWVTLE